MIQPTDRLLLEGTALAIVAYPAFRLGRLVLGGLWRLLAQQAAQFWDTCAAEGRSTLDSWSGTFTPPEPPEVKR